MNYTKAILFIMSFSISLLFFSCEKGIEPEKIEPSRRDFIWTEDTLDIVGLDIYTFAHIVGNTSNDVWMGTFDAKESTGLWHYDGFKWQAVKAPGISYAKSALYIFEDNTLFVGTFSNQISKRENGEWAETFELKVDGFEHIMIFDIYGKSKDNIYAVGVAFNYETDNSPYLQIGVLFHFNGTEWKRVETPEFGGVFHTIKYNRPTDEYLIFASKDRHGGYEDIIISFDGVNIEETQYGKTGVGLSEMNEVLYLNTPDSKVYKLDKSGLYFWRNFGGSGFLTNFVGDSESNFINHSSKGIGHYNGVDYKTIYESDLELQSIGFVENEIFVVGVDYRNTKYIVIHGKLKE